MIRLLFIIVGFAILAIIFIRRYQIMEYGFSPFQLFAKKKAPAAHLTEKKEEETDSLEVTVEEMIPSPDTVDVANVAKADLLIRRADVAMEKGEFMNAERSLIQALMLNPSVSDVYHKLGLMYLRQLQFGKAEMMYRKLIFSGFKEPSYFSNLGLALYQQGKLAEAKLNYKKAVELDESKAGRFFSLAQVLYELDESEEAFLNFQKAIDKDDKNVQYRVHLAYLFWEKGKGAEMKKLLDEILALDPENEEAKSMLQKTEATQKT